MVKLSRYFVAGSLFCGVCCLGTIAHADPVRVSWPQPAGPGSDVFITYSYSNLLDGRFLLLSPEELRAATLEALRLWSSYAPLHFSERPDSGPLPADESYAAAGHPQIRIGHHPMAALAHGYFPGSDGLAGDVHLDEGIPWALGSVRWNLLEVLTHELGHALGLVHIVDRPAIMNASYPHQRFHSLGSAFLLEADIEQLQAIYGAGRGSVRPLSAVPEPSMLVLVATGILGLSAARRRWRVADNMSQRT